MILRTLLIGALLLAALSVACSRPSNQPPPAYLVYVSNEASGDLTIIDPDRPEAVATIPLGKRPRGVHALVPSFMSPSVARHLRRRAWTKAHCPHLTRQRMVLGW